MTPVRTCVGCRRSEAKASLVRLAVDVVGGQVLIDLAQRLPGRGCYLHPGCAPAAIRTRAVGRALRCSVDAAQLAVTLEALKAD